jgi:Arm DNA-binding domain
MTKRLTALFVKSKKLAAGMYCDGGGLYLNVRDSGSRSWIFRYRERGASKQRDLGLGSAGQDGVTLEDARERASELRAGLRRGIDPVKAKEVPEAKTQGSPRRVVGLAFAIGRAIKPAFRGKWQKWPWPMRRRRGGARISSWDRSGEATQASSFPS